MKISYIREKKDTHLLCLGIDGAGESARFTVSRSVYAAVGRPAVGEELTDQAYAELSYADGLYRAEKKALSLLSFADNNERTLYAKLLRAGFDKDIARDVCEKMVSLGYIDERRQLERLITREAERSLCGRQKIYEKLRAKGYDSRLIREVTEGLISRGELDFEENREKLLSSLPEDASEEEIKKTLYKHGYR